ncbi:MAG: type II CRISPR-associated endonuclease Cas1 [Tissierellaceae bacterium]
MSWRNVLVDDGDHLKVYLDNIVIYKGENKYTLPLSDIGIIVLDGMMTSITTRLLSTCSENNVVIVICDKKHLPTGMYLPFNQHSRTVKIINKQIRWSNEKKGKLWQHIIKYKIENQGKVMLFFTDDKERYQQLQEYIESVKIGDESNREGHAAKIYFNTLFGKHFYRDADCIENSMMNYGYAIVRAYIARSIISYGYNPGIGIFHKNEYNAFCLADDILEIFRPVVDFYVILYLQNNESSEFLTQEIRAYLVSILSKRIYFEEHYQKVSTIINKFVLKCFDYLDPDNDVNIFPINLEILLGEGIMK